MKIQSLLRGAVLGAGAAILLAGLALAQTAPATPAAPPAASPPAASAPAATPPTGMERREARRRIRTECRDKARDMRGSERRETMHKCMSEKRAEAGIFSRRERRSQLKQIRESCRAEFKDQRMTEDERRKAMQGCAVKKDPALAKAFACRDEADTKKLERGSTEFRRFMRECHMAR